MGASVFERSEILCTFIENASRRRSSATSNLQGEWGFIDQVRINGLVSTDEEHGYGL